MVRRKRKTKKRKFMRPKEKYTLAKAVLSGITIIILLGGLSLIILPELPGDRFYGLFNFLMGLGLIYSLVMWVKETSR